MTIHCELYTMKGGRKVMILPPIVDTVPEGMGEVKAAHFILAKAAEALPPLPRPETKHLR